MSETIAQFRFLNYKIVESQFQMAQQNIVNAQLNINLQKEVLVNEEERKVRLEMVTNVNDENNLVDIKVKTVGLFEYDEGADAELKDSFFNVNAPAILFPYIRAYVAALTTLSGYNPINLPTINFAAKAEE